MATDVSAILQSLLEKIKNRGFSEKEILQVARDQGDQLLDKFADVIAQASRKPRETYSVVVNYDLSVEQAIEAGDFQAVSANITSKNFLSTRNVIAGCGPRTRRGRLAHRLSARLLSRLCPPVGQVPQA